MKDFTAITTNKNELKKILGVAVGISGLIGGTNGGGLLRTPGSIAQILSKKMLINCCWIFCGV